MLPDMKANVIHGDFNPCGGAERLSLITMQALLEIGIDFDLTTLKSPHISKLQNTYGKNLVSVMEKINKINVINIMEELRQQQEDHEDYNYDITINTNGDDERNDIVLVISRIAPHKKIENAIKLAKILKDNKIGKGMKIVGNLYDYYFDYYSELKHMVLDLGLTDYITFEINASLAKLLYIIGESRVYFHPMVGDHFGMAVVEAIAAGLIPVVPNEGGPTEFVPREYQFNTIEQAAEIITYVFNRLPKTERIKINDNINKFSNSHYIDGFQTILNELLSRRGK